MKTNIIKLQTFHQELHLFEAPDDIRELMPDLVKDLSYKENGRNRVSVNNRLESRTEFHPFRMWVTKCLGVVRSDLDLHCDKLEVSQMWANNARKGDTHHRHRHPNSFASCVYYVTDASASTRFFYHNVWSHSREGMVDLFGTMQKVIDVFPFKGKAGQLIVFPSTLEHDVSECTEDDDDRYTIAINTFPRGIVGLHDNLSAFNA